MPLANFEEYIKGLQEQLSSLVTEPIAVKKINYGQQLVLKRAQEKVILSVYNGKKGVKQVWGGSGGVLQAEAEQVLAGLPVAPVSFGTSKTQDVSLLSNCPGFDYLWAGSDESGKGDFFGPLVVAAVLVNKDIAVKLAKFGVKDSKELTDDKICALAAKIEALAPIHAVLALTPEMYNKRYTELKAQGKNLNHLLSGGHVAALSKVLEADRNCHFALVDRFTMHNTIEQDLKAKFPQLTLVQQPKAEADMAVAAASILARAKFVAVMEELSKLAQVELPKGGGDGATACARKIKATGGEAILNKLIKKHFANFTRL